jgi:hypothetical protein
MKKRHVLFLIIAVLTLSINIQAQAPPEPTSTYDCQADAVAYYQFENDLLGNVFDHIGSFPGEIIGTPSYADGGGVIGDAYSFPGLTSEYIIIQDPARTPTNLLDGRDEFSVSMWLKAQNQPFISTFSATREGGPQFNDFIIWINNQRPAFTFGDGTGINNVPGSNPDNTITNDDWHHVVISVNTNTAVGRIYIDGDLRWEQTRSGAFGTLRELMGLILLGVGQTSGGGTDRPYEGLMDELVIFNKALEPEQVAELSERGSRSINPQLACFLCGNGRIDSGEFCDEGPLNGLPNQCADNCQEYTPAVCGNGIIEDLGGSNNEQCEGLDFGAISNQCSIFDPTMFDGGLLTCNPPSGLNPCRISTLDCTPPEATLQWRNHMNDEITIAGLEWKVKLYYATNDPAITVGSTITFNIIEKGPPDVPIKTLTAEFSSGVREAIAEWTITKEDLDMLPNYDNFIFTVDTEPGIQSEELEIDPNWENRPPEITFTNPEHKQIYFTGTDLNFEATCTDIETPVHPIWTIEEDSFTNTELMFTHSFTNPGQKTITFSCTDEGNPSITTAKQKAILIVGPSPTETQEIFAFIEKPKHTQLVNIDSTTRLIDFAAKDSFVIKSTLDSSCGGQIDCLAGDCPTETKNTPTDPSCPTTLPVTPNPDSSNKYKDLNFDWTFEDGDNSFDGLGSNLNTIKSFENTKLYRTPGHKLIQLLLSYEYASSTTLSKQTNRRFTVIGHHSSCIDNGYTLIYYNPAGQILDEVNTESTPDACLGIDDGDPDTVDECCPIEDNYVCSNTGDSFYCVKESSTIETCDDYTDKDSCNADTGSRPGDVGNREHYERVWENLGCENPPDSCIVTVCGGCIWNPDDDADPDGPGTCGLFWDDVNECTSDAGPSCSLSTCQYSYTDGECNEETNTKEVFVSGTLILENLALPACEGDGIPSGYTEECKDDFTVPVLCGIPDVELPFFSTSQFMLSIISIFLTYLILSRKK